MREMDVALLMGGPSLTNDIHAFLSTIRSANKSSPTHDSYEKRDAEDEEQHRATKKRRKDRDFLFVEQQEPPVYAQLSPNCITCASKPVSMACFLQHMRTRQPLVIERAMDHWPALCEPERQWNNPHYLRKVRHNILRLLTSISSISSCSIGRYVVTAPFLLNWESIIWMRSGLNS